MRRFPAAALAAALVCAWIVAASAAEVSHARVADNGDGTYKNPVLNAGYSDPDVLRVGEPSLIFLNKLPILSAPYSCRLRSWSSRYICQSRR